MRKPVYPMVPFWPRSPHLRALMEHFGYRKPVHPSRRNGDGAKGISKAFFPRGWGM